MDKALVFGTKDCRFESCQGQVFLSRDIYYDTTDSKALLDDVFGV